MSAVTVEIPESSLMTLQVLAEAEKISDAELAARLLTESLAAYPAEPNADDAEEDRKALDDAFGLWADHHEDGLAYQLRMRAEWPD
jgi:hypothetical protein